MVNWNRLQHNRCIWNGERQYYLYLIPLNDWKLRKTYRNCYAQVFMADTWAYVYYFFFCRNKIGYRIESSFITTSFQKHNRNRIRTPMLCKCNISTCICKVKSMFYFNSDWNQFVIRHSLFLIMFCSFGEVFITVGNQTITFIWRTGREYFTEERKWRKP